MFHQLDFHLLKRNKHRFQRASPPANINDPIIQPMETPVRDNKNPPILLTKINHKFCRIFFVDCITTILFQSPSSLLSNRFSFLMIANICLLYYSREVPFNWYSKIGYADSLLCV